MLRKGIARPQRFDIRKLFNDYLVGRSKAVSKGAGSDAVAQG
jgi:hypothetical protein